MFVCAMRSVAKKEKRAANYFPTQRLFACIDSFATLGIEMNES